jgi:hypothetical protein
VQPGRQVNPSGSQIGAALPQSAFEMHCTHCPSRSSQRGAPAGQSPFVRHSTHVCVEVSQSFASAGQSLADAQPTQSPAAVQMGASLGHVAPLAHAAWHWRSDDQHAGVVPLQSAFDTHVTHDPARQCGAAAGQLALAMQSTQPRAGSQVWPESQWFEPFTPHTALAPM